MRKISLDRLSILFIKSEFGEGSIRLFDVEEGLQLRSCQCRLNDGLELSLNSSKPDGSCHLVFFLHAPGLNMMTDCNNSKNSIWDTVFFSSYSTHKIVISPAAYVQCLGISFSKRWLNKNLIRGDEHIRAILKKLNADAPLCMLECMNVGEKKNVIELSAMITAEPITSFYIKSAVLKSVGDFFLKLTQDKALDAF